ncbi:adenylate/guanylate cyclase domain-containing protein [Candidatus Gracilibacteria bacterium]|nr:adenylate/guanylate cyclase domain-containing protein [Candidatus Gracilibacteria bacterium]
MKRFGLLLALFVFCAGIALYSSVVSDPLETINNKITDLFFTSKPVSPEITIIAIDDRSLDASTGLGRFKDWPRSYYAQLLRTIAPAKPAVVGFDLDFREGSTGISKLRLDQLFAGYEKYIQEGGSASQFSWAQLLGRFIPSKDEVSDALSHPDDADFQKALSENGSVVLFEQMVRLANGNFDVIVPIFSGEKVTAGFGNALSDRDGVMRRLINKMGDEVSFSYEIALRYMETKGKTLAVKATTTPERIRYVARPGSYNTISFSDVLANKFDENLIKGKIVLIGGTAPVINDNFDTPTSKTAMPGVEIHATRIQQLLENRTVTEQGFWGMMFVFLIICGGMGYLFMTQSLRLFAIVFGVGFFLYPLLAFLAYQKGYVMNVVYPQSALILTALAVLWYRNKTELREKRMIKNAFAHYVSPVIVNELVEQPQMLKLGGKRQIISVLFSDIVGFTTLSEKLTPEDTVALLNDYLSAMTDVIFQHNGTLDKYQGDAIMALFGAPLEDKLHPINAVTAALKMRAALTLLHEKWDRIPTLPFKQELINLDFRVGISTGPAVIGNVGSEKRFDYTAIGDIVNLGSRLESLNRKYGTKVMIDKGTFQTITSMQHSFLFRKLDSVRVKGKKMETDIFEVVGVAEAMAANVKGMLDHFENGRIQYIERNFLVAKQHFEDILAQFPDDGPSQIYRNRCDFYLRKPAPRDWSPVVTLDEK